MDILGYLASVLIGISLGLIGSGGSILTVPVLVYLFSIDAVLATAYSLFIVGFTSAVGSFSYFRKKLVSLKTVFIFGLSSIVSVVLTRAYILPSIPEVVTQIGSFTLHKNSLLLLLFGVLMIAASYRMIKTKKQEEATNNKLHLPYGPMLLQGIFVGMVTGLVGAGGGFLIIPALVHFLKMPIKKAVGTSLFIIAINSLSGFVASLGLQEMNWSLLISITLIAAVGIFIGSYFSTKIAGTKLKPIFGWFILVMGIFILFKESILS